ncbi:P2 phage tail completion protein R (GpR) [Serratia entomophila]|uniref:phage tail protein n=1 Tax=Serratia entomophila TaxID=42906 RepID=UPI00217843CC|nr:phage tail protein [Serratia entomophila]CAI1156553.1 P2 phage tail completion protein R (GpR) [Serratia entomophila]CAI1176058.1 P2 phage tail completion protein R (GpR) [Serratia entomophila]
MSQIESLTTFFEQHMPPRAMQFFESAMQDATLVYSAKALGLGQRRLGVFRYNAALNWDRFPYRLCPPALVYALLFAWMEAHRNKLYDELALGEPTVDIEFDEEETGTLEILIELVDEITVTPDDGGEIPLSGKRWRLAYPETHTATKGYLYGAAENGAPLGGDSED